MLPLRNIGGLFEKALGYGDEGGNRGGKRVASANKKANGLGDVRCYQRDRLELTRSLDSVDQPRRNDTDPVPGTNVCEKRHHRIRFESWCTAAAVLLQHRVDDATALRVGRQETKREPRRLAPGHFVETGKRIARADEQHVALCIERHRVQAPDRLVVDVGNADIVSNFDRISADVAEKTDSRTRGQRA